jgi:opacity protein-like surface antigen
MKKVFLLLVMIMLCGFANAQYWNFKGGYETNRHNLGVELALGGTGDMTVDLGLKWMINFNENLAWDVLTVRAGADVEHSFVESIVGELMTGPRIISPEFGDMTAYLNGRAGYAHHFDSSEGGFAYEFGAGINVTPHISLGYSYNHFKIDSFGIKYHAFRVGFLF